MNRDPSTMAVGPAARKALQVMLERLDPLEPIQASVLARLIGVPVGNVSSALRRLTEANILSKATAGNGFPTWWKLEPAAIHHARELSTRLHERTAADDGREAGQVELPVWLGGHPAKVYAQAWQERKRAAARGAT
jgi:DNA-binding transcriptional ArsR family regulator